ncbi:MAG: FAD-dependent oxidoreductase [Burkholderiaceae bacterium]
MGTRQKKFAVIGAGIAGIACARTLVQAGHHATLFEEGPEAGGRTATRDSPFGTFDHGAQYFTVRDERFARALETVPGLCRPWSANTVRVLDPLGRVAAASLPPREPHWVPAPGMQALAARWAQPLAAAGALELGTRVSAIARDAVDASRWQLHTEGQDESLHVHSGFDAVMLAIPASRARALLQASRLAPRFIEQLAKVQVAPCWTLMLAFPQAQQPSLAYIGPQWNAARSTHHRVAWLARESSKPGRGPVERWTVQASAAWSQEHLEDDGARVKAKLLRAFSEITGVRAEPSHAEAFRWRNAQTLEPLGRTHLWDGKAQIGLAGDWCLGHRVENAFVSGLELALAAA